MEYKLLSSLFFQDQQKYNEIYNARISSESTIIFDFSLNGNKAFCCLTNEIQNMIYNIQKNDQKIYKLCWSLPPIALEQFINRCLVDEIVLTNDIEGVNSTRREINGILSDLKKKDKRKRFYGLVQKYSMLGKSEQPLNTCEDIRNLYDELVLPEILDDDKENAPDGKIFRKDLSEVVSPTQKILHRGLFPEEKIISAMEDALKILNDENINILIRVSVFHYLFGFIHPFYDGNGRTSRFISSYLLANEFESPIEYRLSYTIKENITAYYKAFKTCNDKNNKGDLTPFVIMFLDIIQKSMSALYQALEKRANSLNYYSQKASQLKIATEKTTNDILFILVQASLFSEEGVTKTEILSSIDAGLSTLNNRLKMLEQNKDLIIKKKFSHEYKYKLNLEFFS